MFFSYNAGACPLVGAGQLADTKCTHFVFAQFPITMKIYNTPFQNAKNELLSHVSDYVCSDSNIKNMGHLAIIGAKN